MDELVVEDFDETHLSCDVSLRELNFAKNEILYYTYDFGDKHRFCLKLLSENNMASGKKPFLIGIKGNDISQNPLCIDGIPYIRINESHPAHILYKEIKYYDNRFHRKQVRFIQEIDFEILQQWRKSKNKRKWEKSVVILENDNMSYKELSKKIERPIRKIKSWIKIFNAYGLEGLKIEKKKSKSNLKSEMSQLKTNRIIEIFHQKPRTFGINRSNWSQESIANVYEKQYGESIGRSTVGHLIRNAGYKMKKAKQVLTSPDPNYREKVELLLNTIQSLNSNEMFFFLDELGPLRVKKYGGRCYLKKGEIRRVPKVQASKGSITLFRALSATTNQLSWNYGISKDTSAMIDLIETLYNQNYVKSKIYITWDAVSWHRSNELLDWLDNFNAETNDIGEGPLIEFIPLPTSSQFLNVIESIFSVMKKAVVHHSDYQSEEEMKSAVSGHFVERNVYFKKNPRRAGKKIWEIDFFLDYNNMKFGDYMKW